jgi:glutamate-1-semialdehyde 2,1-aminomutase
MMNPEQRIARIRELVGEQTQRFLESNPKSLEWCKRAVAASMPLGAPTNVSALDPYPLFIDHGEGAYVHDVDGNVRVDYNNGFGSLPIGPAVVAAIQKQAAKGTHFGTSTEPVVEWAEHLCQRFGLDWVRFSASGTEATMDAIRLARTATSRVRVIKCEGAYHGSHGDGLISINQPLDEFSGPDDAPASRPGDDSIPQILADNVIVVPFNNLAAAERALAEPDVACFIVEPIMFNVGHIHPQAGYLQGLRDACDRHGVKLIFDEVKTAATIAYGGAEEMFGVRPHIKCFAKSICGGLPGGAFGDTDGQMFTLIEEMRMMHVGTLSGNPLTSAAGLAALTLVLTPDAYPRLQKHADELARGLEAVISRHHMSAYVTHVAAKGCLVWADHRLRDFRDYQRSFDGDIAFLAWLFLLNEGVFLAPGHDEQFTISVAHTPVEAQLFITAFSRFADYASELFI